MMQNGCIKVKNYTTTTDIKPRRSKQEMPNFVTLVIVVVAPEHGGLFLSHLMIPRNFNEFIFYNPGHQSGCLQTGTY
jgi:hypothetical protein